MDSQADNGHSGDDDETRLAHGDPQTPGTDGLGAAGASKEAAAAKADDEPKDSDTRLANGPVQTDGVEGLGAGGAES